MNTAVNPALMSTSSAGVQPISADLKVKLVNGEIYEKIISIQPFLIDKLEIGEELKLIDLKTKRRGKISIFVKAEKVTHGIKMGLITTHHVSLELVETREDLSDKEI